MDEVVSALVEVRQGRPLSFVTPLARIESGHGGPDILLGRGLDPNQASPRRRRVSSRARHKVRANAMRAVDGIRRQGQYMSYVPWGSMGVSP